MGLDIHLCSDLPQEIINADIADEKNDFFHQHSLSRTFCNFMCRRNLDEVTPELDQIGQITGTNISVLYEMENYPDANYLEFLMENADNKKERERILAEMEMDKENLKGNIDQVLETIINLIGKLNLVENLPGLLSPTKLDTIGIPYYFSDFKEDKGDGYIGNNFGQDLRNFKRFLEYAKNKGATTVWFNYG